jgi:diguanylate cyclase (GGDEF)-like protein
LHELPSSPFSPGEDRNLVLALAAQAAVAIENARLLAEAERRATTDFLTGLYNRAFFHDTLYREVSGSVRYGHPTSLLLLDLDDFKQVNDTHGHRAGDEVLRRLGELLRSQCRESDFPARYGGEEFAVILTHTGAEGAQVAAERLRTAVSYQPWDLEAVGNGRWPGLRIANCELRIAEPGAPSEIRNPKSEIRNGRGRCAVPSEVTVSIGIATCPADAADMEALLRAADAALYAAKRAGKNCVRAYEELTHES